MRLECYYSRLIFRIYLISIMFGKVQLWTNFIFPKFGSFLFLQFMSYLTRISSVYSNPRLFIIYKWAIWTESIGTQCVPSSFATPSTTAKRAPLSSSRRSISSSSPKYWAADNRRRPPSAGWLLSSSNRTTTSWLPSRWWWTSPSVRVWVTVGSMDNYE